MQLTDKYDAIEDKKNLFMLQKMYEKTKLDGAFQRWGGKDRGSGWTNSQGIAYIQNFLQGGTFNYIINVSVPDALRYAHEIREQQSIKYFTQLTTEGVEYVSVDGNNSASYLCGFIDDDQSIKIRSDKRSNPVSFSGLSEELQQDIKYTEKMRVVVLRRITVQEMCVLFRALNTSTQLNHQEYRQARWSPLSKYIRDKGDEMREFFLNFNTNREMDLDTRGHEEKLAAYALKVEKSGEPNKKGLDAFYENTSELSQRARKTIETVLDNAKAISKDQGALQKKLPVGVIHTLFDVIQIACVDEPFKIVDPVGFLRWFLDKDGAFKAAAAQLPDDEEVKQKRSYTYWQKFYSKSAYYENIRKLFKTSFLEEVEDLCNDGTLKYVRGPKDSFSWADKLELFEKQNAETREGDKISMLDLYLGKYEADHVKSVADGGATVIENGELMERSKNRSKGAKSNEPHFEFQKETG